MSWLPSPPSDRPFDVVGLGQNAVDHLYVVPSFPPFGTKVRIAAYERQGGGQVATAMVACRRLGLRAAYVGAVGDDRDGRFGLECLRSEGVDVSAVRVRAGASSQYAVILIDRTTGERTIAWDADDSVPLGPEELRPEEVGAGRVLHLDVTRNDTAIEAARRARAAGSVVSIDADRVAPRIEELLPLIDLCIASENFPADLTGERDPVRGLRALARRCPGFVAMTRGRRGALALVGGEPLASPGFAVDAVDTTGCGDVFHAAFIAALLDGGNVADCLRFANAAAALKTLRLGGRPGIPTRLEVERFLASNPPTVPLE